MLHANESLVEIDANLLYETTKAFLLRVDANEAWVPKSLVEHNGCGFGFGSFTMPRWLAYKHGFI